MDAALLVPIADAMPGPGWWFETLLLVTFVLHLLLMNTALGGAVIVAVLSLRNKPAERSIIRDFSTRLPTALALAINMGIPPLLFLQVLHGQFFYVSSILMAFWWLAIVGLIMLGYYGLYIFAINQDELGNRRTVVAVVAALLLLATSFILTNNMTLMLQPDNWAAWFDQRNGMFHNLDDVTVLPRWLHMATAAIAIGGLALALFHVRRMAWGAAEATTGIDIGLRWFMGGTMLQFIFGPWFLLSLPRPFMLLFMGHSPLATAAFVLGLSGACLSLLAARKRNVGLTVITACGTVLAMTIMRAVLRRAYLEPYGALPPVAHVEASPLVVFLLAVAGGSAAIIYMMQLARRTNWEK